MPFLADLLRDPDPPADASAVHWGGVVHTRGEISDAADRVAATLQRMGTAPDSAVAAAVPPTPLGLVMLLGVWRAGAVAAPLDAADGPETFEALIGALRPATVMRPSLDAASLVPQISVHPGEPRRFDPDVAVVLTAPGPAGRLRSVQWTETRMAAAIASAEATLRFRTGGLLTLPLASPAGLDVTLVALAAGGSVELLEPVEPAALADAIRRHRVEAVTLTPDQLDALVDDAGVATIEPLRYVRCVEGTVSEEHVRRARARFGVVVLGAYGRPEIGGEVVGWGVGEAAVDGDLKPGSVGRPYAGVEVRVQRADRSPAAPGEVGEVWVRSPFAMHGYASDRVEPDYRVDGDGFVHVGDHGHLDRDGFLWIDAPAG